jgi:hypothetical protein
MDTKLKGDIAEQAAILQALKRGWGVLRPVGDRLQTQTTWNEMLSHLPDITWEAREFNGLACTAELNN